MGLNSYQRWQIVDMLSKWPAAVIVCKLGVVALSCSITGAAYYSQGAGRDLLIISLCIASTVTWLSVSLLWAVLVWMNGKFIWGLWLEERIMLMYIGPGGLDYGSLTSKLGAHRDEDIVRLARERRELERRQLVYCRDGTMELTTSGFIAWSWFTNGGSAKSIERAARELERMRHAR